MFFDIVIRRLFYFAGLILLAVIELQTFAYNPCGEQYQTAGNYQQFKDICGGVMWRSLKWFVGLEPNTLNAYSTLVTALSTIFIAFFTFSLMNSTKRQWEVANRNFAATHRPKVIVRFIQGPFFDPPGEDKRCVIITITNIGPTTAHITHIGADMNWRNHLGEWSVPGIDASAKPVENLSLVSGQRYWFNAGQAGPRPIYQMFGDQARKGGLCVLGIVKYRDEAGVFRETGFCRTFDNESGRFVVSDDPEEEYQD